MSNKKFLVAIGMFLVALLIGAIALVIHVGNNSDGSISVAKDDPGVAVCKVMAEPAAHPKLDDTWRQERVAAFRASQYPDLTEAGVNLTEAAYQMDNMPESADLDKVNELNNRLKVTHSTLRAACKNHGVNLPPLGA